jgi:hypothetical protein
MSRAPATITFVTRRNCSVCDEARDHLLPVAERRRLEVDVVDVDTDPELLAAYGAVVPVVLSSRGRVLASGRISARQARLVVLRARCGRSG